LGLQLWNLSMDPGLEVQSPAVFFGLSNKHNVEVPGVGGMKENEMGTRKRRTSCEKLVYSFMHDILAYRALSWPLSVALISTHLNS
jgi:hypothetical protein